MSKKRKDNEENTVIITKEVKIDEQPTLLEPYLIQVSGREAGQMHHLTGKTLKIGRDPACSIYLDDPHISRLHAEILCNHSQGILIRDLGSTNGVSINGQRISEHLLSDGDKILIGTRMYFKFQYQDTVDAKYQQTLFQAATVDALTGLYNKKYFVDVLSKDFSYSRRNKAPLSLLMMDIDFFKKINDTYGHPAGDYVLKTVGQFLAKQIRMENIACRFGGEEFSIILRNVGADLAFSIAERIRMGIEKEKLEFKGKNIPVTISIGIATLDSENFDTFEDLIQAADENLYEAKDGGRNRTILKKAA